MGFGRDEPARALLRDGSMVMSQRFLLREWAERWANEERRAHETGALD